MKARPYQQIWKEVAPFTLPDATQDAKRECEYAASFRRWCEDEVFAPLARSPSVGQTANAMLALQERFFRWWRHIPKAHRRLAPRGHVCVFAIYEEMYERLERMLLASRPMLLAEDQTAEPAPGLYIGEESE